MTDHSEHSATLGVFFYISSVGSFYATIEQSLFIEKSCLSLNARVEYHGVYGKSPLFYES